MANLNVVVPDGDINKALKTLKRKMIRNGVVTDAKRQEHYLKPGEKRRAKYRRAVKRLRKMAG